jgi:hypothetical protein
MCLGAWVDQVVMNIDLRVEGCGRNWLNRKYLARESPPVGGS